MLRRIRREDLHYPQSWQWRSTRQDAPAKSHRHLLRRKGLGADPKLSLQKSSQ